MDTGEALARARELLDEFGLHDWTAVLDTRALRRLGQCRHKPKEIGLSKGYVELNDRDEVEDTIRHEIAHALAGHEAGHGPIWEAWCLKTGATPNRCGNGDIVTPPAPLALVCDKCGYSTPRYRRVKRGYWYTHTPDGGRMEIQRVE